MSGRQPRLFGMNRYSVIQSVFNEDDTKELLALNVPQTDIDDQTKETDLRKKLKPKPSGGSSGDDGCVNKCCKTLGGCLNCLKWCNSN